VLYESFDGDTPAYGLEESEGATPIAVVWRNPIEVALPVADYLPELRADAGPDRCMDEPGPLALEPGEWTLDGAPFEPGGTVAEGLHVVERTVTRADGFARSDSFILRVGERVTTLEMPESGGCGCSTGRESAVACWIALALVAWRARRG
jgi:hypothetical protein